MGGGEIKHLLRFIFMCVYAGEHSSDFCSFIDQKANMRRSKRRFCRFTAAVSAAEWLLLMETLPIDE